MVLLVLSVRLLADSEGPSYAAFWGTNENFKEGVRFNAGAKTIAANACTQALH